MRMGMILLNDIGILSDKGDKSVVILDVVDYVSSSSSTYS